RADGGAGESVRAGGGGEGPQRGTATRTSRNRRRRRRGSGGGRGERPRQEQEQGATVDEQPDISVEEQVDQAVDFTRGLVEAFGAKAEGASHLGDEDTVLVEGARGSLG